MTSSELMEDYSSDEDPLSPSYGVFGSTAIRQRNGNGSTLSADIPSEQRTINLGELHVANRPVATARCEWVLRGC